MSVNANRPTTVNAATGSDAASPVVAQPMDKKRRPLQFRLRTILFAILIVWRLLELFTQRGSSSRPFDIGVNAGLIAIAAGMVLYRRLAPQKQEDHEKPQRLQYSLGTAVCVVLVAGVLLWANIIGFERSIVQVPTITHSGPSFTYAKMIGRGFPVCFEDVDDGSFAAIVLVDIFASIVICILVAVSLERIIRRGEARKT